MDGDRTLEWLDALEDQVQAELLLIKWQLRWGDRPPESMLLEAKRLAAVADALFQEFEFREKAARQKRKRPGRAGP